MRLVENAVIVNLELITNSGITPIEAFVLSALEHHVMGWVTSEVFVEKDEEEDGTFYFTRDLVDKIAREMCFIFVLNPSFGVFAVDNLIEQSWIVEDSSIKSASRFFLPHI